MTFYHFVNCLVLTFAPLYILFKYSSLSEAGSIWRCGWALGAYILTQLCKYLIVATLMIPAPPSIDCAFDCLALFYVLTKQQKASLPQVKILSVALGWSFGENLLTRFAGYFLNARSLQFDWDYIMVAIDSNISLVQNVCLCSLLWLLSRGCGSTSRFVINATTKKPAIIIGLYVLSLTFVSHSMITKLISVSFLAMATVYTVDLRK